MKLGHLGNGLKYDCFLHTTPEVEAAAARGAPIVTLAYQDFCDPCRSTKHYVEELCRKHGFYLVRVHGALSWDPERAGEIVPHLQVHRGDHASIPLVGAHTALRITEYLMEQGVIDWRREGDE
jgi:hypothetical protein